MQPPESKRTGVLSQPVLYSYYELETLRQELGSGQGKGTRSALGTDSSLGKDSDQDTGKGSELGTGKGSELGTGMGSEPDTGMGKDTDTRNTQLLRLLKFLRC